MNIPWSQFLRRNNLDFVGKRYISRYLPHFLFEGILYMHYEKKRNTIDKDGEK